MKSLFCSTREEDEELDAIVYSAQLLLSSLSRPSLAEREDAAADNLLRASILALFVSDCFGGSERGDSLMRTRRAVVSLNKQQPFICTCYTRNIFDSTGASKQLHGFAQNVNFSDLCDRSIHFIKETHNSNVVPIGKLQFGVCRHRAVLMKASHLPSTLCLLAHNSVFCLFLFLLNKSLS